MRFQSHSIPSQRTKTTSETGQPKSSAAGSSKSTDSSLEKRRQTMTELDADHLEKMREAMGGTDMANIEMEDGIPDRGMKRNVRENMFRII